MKTSLTHLFLCTKRRLLVAGEAVLDTSVDLHYHIRYMGRTGDTYLSRAENYVCSYVTQMHADVCERLLRHHRAS